VAPKDLLPVARPMRAGRLPGVVDGPRACLTYSGDEYSRHLFPVLLLTGRAVVPRAAKDARLILDLQADDSVLAVLVAQEPAQGYESRPVRRQRGLTVRGQRPDRRSSDRDDPWEALRRPLHPSRSVVHVSVLPRSEPEQDEAHAIVVRQDQQVADRVPDKTPLLRLDLLPIDGHFHGVSVQLLNRTKSLLGLRPAVAAGVVRLPAQREERTTIHAEDALYLGHGSPPTPSASLLHQGSAKHPHRKGMGRKGAEHRHSGQVNDAPHEEHRAGACVANEKEQETVDDQLRRLLPHSDAFWP